MKEMYQLRRVTIAPLPPYATINARHVATHSLSRNGASDPTTTQNRRDILVTTLLSSIAIHSLKFAGAEELAASAPAATAFSVSQAIQDAAPGDVIFIPGGTYHERLIINKPIELRAAPGQQVTVTWQTEKPYESTIVLTASSAVVSGLTVRHSSPSIANNYAIQIIDCRARVEACDVSSATGSGVGVEGSGAEIVGCRVHDCQRNGVLIAANLSGEGDGVVLGGCTVEVNKLHGMIVTEGAAPVVEGNIFRGNGGFGMALQGCGGAFRQNRLAGNRRGAVAYTLLDGIDVGDLAQENGLGRNDLQEVTL